jgi:hypothetical protein
VSREFRMLVVGYIWEENRTEVKAARRDINTPVPAI